MAVIDIDIELDGGIGIMAPEDHGDSILNIHVGKDSEALLRGNARQLFTVSRLIEAHLLHLIERGRDVPLESLRRWVRYLKMRLDQLERTLRERSESHD